MDKGVVAAVAVTAHRHAAVRQAAAEWLFAGDVVGLNVLLTVAVVHGLVKDAASGTVHTDVCLSLFDRGVPSDEIVFGVDAVEGGEVHVGVPYAGSTSDELVGTPDILLVCGVGVS